MPNFPLKACFRSNSLTLRPCSIFLQIVSKFFLPAGWSSKIFPHFMKVVKRPIAFSDVLLKYQGIAWKSFMILKRRHSRSSIIMPLCFGSLLPLLIIGNKLRSSYTLCSYTMIKYSANGVKSMQSLTLLSWLRSWICCRCLYLGAGAVQVVLWRWWQGRRLRTWVRSTMCWFLFSLLFNCVHFCLIFFAFVWFCPL